MAPQDLEVKKKEEKPTRFEYEGGFVGEDVAIGERYSCSHVIRK